MQLGFETVGDVSQDCRMEALGAKHSSKHAELLYLIMPAFVLSIVLLPPVISQLSIRSSHNPAPLCHVRKKQ